MLKEFAQSRNKDISDVDLQIEYLLGELSPTSGAALGYATFQCMPGYESEYQTWLTSGDIAEATLAFRIWFERPSIPHDESRISAAQSYYEQYHK